MGVTPKAPIPLTASDVTFLQNAKGDHLCFFKFTTNLNASAWYYRFPYTYYHIGGGPKKCQEWGEQLPWTQSQSVMFEEHKYRFLGKEAATINHSYAIRLTVKRLKHLFTILTYKGDEAIWRTFEFTTPDEWPDVDYPQNPRGQQFLPIITTEPYWLPGDKTISQARMTAGTL